MEGEIEDFKKYASLDASEAPQNTEMEFLAFCGVLGLGYHLEEDMDLIHILRELASDDRWRIREAVTLGLQHWGKINPDKLFVEMSGWAKGNNYEKRAVVAALCEPKLLEVIQPVTKVFDILDEITPTIIGGVRDESFSALRKTLGYGWSVVVSVNPVEGKPRMVKWIDHDDHDVIWVMKQNLGKKRLTRMDESWVKQQLRKLS